MWATVLTMALLLGSGFIQKFMPIGHLLDFKSQMQYNWQALFFLGNTFIVLISSARLAPSFFLKSSFMLIAAVVCFEAAILFSILPQQPSQFLDSAIHGIKETVVAPVAVINIISSHSARDIIRLVVEWFLSTRGNLFEVTTGLAKIFWMIALIQLSIVALENMTGGAGKSTNLTRSQTLTEEEVSTFTLCLVSFLAIVIGLSLSHIDAFQVAFGAVLLVAIPSLLWNLFKSRQFIVSNDGS